MISETTALPVEQQTLKGPRDVITGYRLMSVEEVAEHFQVSRSTVDQMPREILPYVDFAPTPKRQLKRFHPLDVLAAQARFRGWRAAQEQRKGESFLQVLREELTARDAQWLELAHKAAEVVA
jgi:hypothetical protein